MRRLPALLAAALTLGALAVPHAGAAPDDIVLTGSTSGYVDIRFGTGMNTSPPVVETRGRFGGYFALDLEPDFEDGNQIDYGGFVAVRGMSASPDTLDPMRLGGTTMLGPGLIRFYLIADGPTTVRIPTSGSGARGGTYRVKPAPLHPQLRTAPLVRSGDTWVGQTPQMKIAQGSPSLVAVRASGDLSALAEVNLCLRAPKQACPPAQPAGRGSSRSAGGNGVLDPEQRWESTQFVEYAPYGHLVGAATVAPVEPIRGGLVVAFTITVPKGKKQPSPHATR